MKMNKKSSKKLVGIAMNASGLRSLRHAARAVSESATAILIAGDSAPRRHR
jgi:hypothetical protein